MNKSKKIFSIQIATKNRLSDLIFTLNKIKYLIVNESIECLVFDVGSSDGTFDFVNENYPDIKISRNETSKGYIFCRNKMLNQTEAEFAISLDDDAHFLSDNPLELIRNYFQNNNNCSIIGFRIFWGLEDQQNFISTEKPQIVKGFVGCGHAWRMSDWRKIPNYPEWFIFYGEEEFAAYQLFKKKLEIHYLPTIFIKHRVDLKARKSNNSDYIQRLEKSLTAGWFLFFMFYPVQKIPRIFIYSIWMQLKLKVFKGDFKALKAILLALFDLVLAIPNIIKHSNRFSIKEFKEYEALQPTKIYWQEEK
jgi:GT2 family glycosyltransferase